MQNTLVQMILMITNAGDSKMTGCTEHRRKGGKHTKYFSEMHSHQQIACKWTSLEHVVMTMSISNIRSSSIQHRRLPYLIPLSCSITSKAPSPHTHFHHQLHPNAGNSDDLSHIPNLNFSSHQLLSYFAHPRLPNHHTVTT